MSLILGIDPGSRLCGYGLIEATGNRLAFVDCGFIEVAELAFPLRLHLSLAGDRIFAALDLDPKHRRVITGIAQRLLFGRAQAHPLVRAVAAVAEEPAAGAVVSHLHVEAGRNPVHALLGEGVHLRSGERASLSQFDEPQVLWSAQTCVLGPDYPELS